MLKRCISPLFQHVSGISPFLLLGQCLCKLDSNPISFQDAGDDVGMFRALTMTLVRKGSKSSKEGIVVKVGGDNFSCGGDDCLNIRGLKNTVFEMTIYNRWNVVVYHSKNIDDNPWQGRVEDRSEVPEGFYSYILTVKDDNLEEHIYRGSIRLDRD